MTTPQTYRWAGVTFVMLASLAWMQSRCDASPAIFNATETATPGDVIALQGSDYSVSPAVLIATVNTSGITSSQTSLAVQTQSPTTLAAKIPTTYATGLYKVWVQDGTGDTSDFAFMNRARITSFEFAEVDPSRQFRIFGRNLVVPGGTPSVRFVDNATSANLTATILSGGNPYIATIQAPASLTSGHTYTVYYRNGLGGSIGEVAAPVSIVARAGGSDPFSLGVPWGADFGSLSANVYNVKTDTRLSTLAAGDGSADDTSSIQSAINLAASSGGGVVYLPSGTYRVATFGGTGGGVGLTMKSNVVLAGDGQGLTFIDFQAPSTVSDHTGIITYNSGSSVSGLLNLTIQNSTQNTQTAKIYPMINAASASKFFMRNVTVDGRNWVRGGIRLSSPSTAPHKLITNCTIKNMRIDGPSFFTKDYGSASNTSQYIAIRNCTFPNINEGSSLGGKNIIFENNTFTYDGDNYHYLVNTLGQTMPAGGRNRINLSGPDIVVLNNTFNHIGAPYVNNNDGENLLAEDPGNNGSPTVLGTATSGDSTSLTDTTRAWTANQFIGYQVALLDGTGKGQVRNVSGNTANSLTVSPAWTVPPSSTSRYAVNRLNVPRLLIKGNTMQDKDSIASLFEGAYDIAIVENTALNSRSLFVRGESGNTYANPVINALVADNTITAVDESAPSAVVVNAAYPINTRFVTNIFNVELRRNTVSAKSTEAYQATNTQTTYGLWHPAGNTAPLGLEQILFDRNSAKDCLTAFGWTPGVTGLTISNFSATNILRASYDITHGDGIIVPGASLSTGNVLTDDGTGYLDLGPLKLSTSLTIEGRFKTAATNAAIISNRSIGSAVLSISGGKLAVWDNSFSGSGEEQTPSAYNDNVWHSFAWTYDSSTHQIYVDGVLRKASTRNRSASTGYGWLGIDGPGTGWQERRLNGQLSEIRVWDGVRAAADIVKYQNTRLAGDEPGLVQNWRLDEGSGPLARNHYLSAALSDGLVGYWRLDEGTLTVVNDSSGQGNAGTVNNPGAASWVEGYIGSALSFDGTTGFISVPDSATLNMTTAFSVHARFCIDSISTSWPNNWRGLVCKGDPDASSSGWEIGTYSPSTSTGTPTVSIFARRGSIYGSISCYSGTALAMGRYYTVDAVWDSSTGKLSIYLDGVFEKSVFNTSPQAASSAILTIGKRLSGGAFVGKTDDIRVYNRALTSWEIKELQ